MQRPSAHERVLDEELGLHLGGDLRLRGPRGVDGGHAVRLIGREHEVEAEPLAVKAPERATRAVVGEHAPRLGAHLVLGRERVCGGRVEERVIGDACPEQERHARRERVWIDRNDAARARVGLGDGLGPVDELRRLEHRAQRVSCTAPRKSTAACHPTNTDDRRVISSGVRGRRKIRRPIWVRTCC